jgi:hypothetical protein
LTPLASRNQPTGDSYAPPAGAPFFAPPTGGGIWAAAHQCSLFCFLFSYFVIISEGFLALFFLPILWISIFLLVFFGFAGRFLNI